jgi:hypothetical protein
MATPIQFPSELALRMQLLLEDNHDELVTPDGRIFYGDQNLIPVTPTLCVEPGTTSRTLAGVPRRTENQLTCYLLWYYAVVDSNQTTKPASDVGAEVVARYLDQNPTLEREGDGGVVIHGFITDIDPGYSLRGNQKNLYHAVRLTWTGKTKTMLGA